MKPIAVIGAGNVFMKDEGIGPRVVEQLIAQESLPDEVECMDMGIDGWSIVHALAGRRAILLIDCALMDTPPGTMREFTPDSVNSLKPLSSAHDCDILKILQIARIQGDCPERVVILGVEPAEIAFGMGLSSTLSENLPYYCETVRQAVEKLAL